MRDASAAFLGLILIALLARGAVAEPGNPGPTRKPDVGFVATPQPMVAAMLKLADVQPGEIVYDLGCGDGRAVITAARDFGARGVGVDIDPELIAQSRANAAAAGVSDRVRFEQADLFTLPFADADVVFLYLLPDLNVRLRPRILDELKPGTRVVSHAFPMGEWKPDRVSQVADIPILLWVVPAKVAGTWQVTLPDGNDAALVLQQTFQEVTGTLSSGDRTVPLREVRLRGATLTFGYRAGWRVHRVVATLVEGRLSGTLQRGWFTEAQPWSAVRR